MQCKGQTKKGHQCARTVADGHFCHQHAPPPDGADPLDMLTDKQRRFVDEYLVDFNATRAAERAGYGGDYVTLRSIGSENLTKPNIAAAISERMEQLGMGAVETIGRMTEWGRASIDVFIADYTEDGKPIFDLSTPQAKAHMHLIKGIKYDKFGNMVIELHDAKDAVTTLMKTHNLFRESLDISVVDKRADELRDKSEDLDDVSDEELAAMTEVFSDT